MEIFYIFIFIPSDLEIIELWRILMYTVRTEIYRRRLNCLQASTFILNRRCQPLFIYETLMPSPTSSSRIRVLSTEKYILPLFMYYAWKLTGDSCRKFRLRVCPPATNRLNAAEDDRGWWYAAFPSTLIRFMLITLSNGDFQRTTAMILINGNVAAC